jgi:hypothetical protein
MLMSESLSLLFRPAIGSNVLPTGVRRFTESRPDVKDRKFVPMLK